eukprot:TRINITY_DN7424_c0_g1_i1.p1 TRINITY_DN7424_c0_g1~~TRINITY_DN7424_c0_g1_i1.p1  ORF type:complete len:310 (-),score=88.33 TRINITY_DN7424_c0_g1_i1:79-972(-)
MANTNLELKGKTVFITGASRGIGLAIALKCAQEGANVVLAAKTDKPDPRLPGTIFSAAKEIEAAGGKALPIRVDIRFEDQIKEAMELAVKTFGGIDVVINNASAIFPMPVAETPMKRYDLMNTVNARGTYATTQAALPYLIESAKKGRNPHVLMLSPPLNMAPKWFSGRVAYTMAKYGMSMCVLGMADEFKPYGIGVNALWPRTGIATAAIQNLLGGEEAMRQCRKPEIISDSAYYILTSPASECTGNFFVDDKLLETVGITNLDKYAVTPGTKEFFPDFFIEPTDGYGVGLSKAKL